MSSKVKTKPSCFLCPELGSIHCPNCDALYCSPQHGALHHSRNYCFPYKVKLFSINIFIVLQKLQDGYTFQVSFMKGKGRILLATRDIKPLDLVLVDPGTVIGPNYRSRRVCLECLKLAEGSYTCEDCDFPLCDEQCYGRERHRPECTVLKQLKGTTSEFPGYACVTVLRLLLLSKSGSDEWQRTDKLMDHLSEKNVHPQEWLWYQTHIIDFIRNDLKLGDMFPVEQIERAIGLLNVNAVCLQFPRVKGTPNNEVGKGIYWRSAVEKPCHTGMHL